MEARNGKTLPLTVPAVGLAVFLRSEKMNKTITSEIVAAYSQCSRKAFQLMCTDEKGTSNEYIQVLEEETKKNRESYLKKIKDKLPKEAYNLPNGLNHGIPIIFEASLKTEEYQASATVLTAIEKTSSKRKPNYSPTLIIGTHKINKQQKLQLAFTGYVLSKCQKEESAFGTLIANGGKPHKIKLETLYKDIKKILRVLASWSVSPELESPPVILNKHCPYCPFQKQCEVMAKESDHLSLLGGIGQKEIEKYNKRGIFTVNQLSYMFRPRKIKKRKENYVKPHSFPLQAWAIRAQQIYVYETPRMPKSKLEIFFDIEGIPDEEFQYLIGLLIKENDQVNHYFFWASNKDEELIIFQDFLHLLDKYDDYTLFHYGTYETNYLKRMSKKLSAHEKDTTEKALRSCCNILSYLYSNIYFPTYTNGLKDIGRTIGFNWSDSNSSGLQSLVWRKRWERTQHHKWKNKLILYNKEDCLAISKIKSLIDAIIGNDGSDNRTSLPLEIVYRADLKEKSRFSFMYKDYAGD
ncbi:MAG: TM0106 family RecB-like putative nuclease [Thermodesulfobacteriota bacterium]